MEHDPTKYAHWGHCSTCGKDLIVLPDRVEITEGMQLLADMFKCSLYNLSNIPSACSFCQSVFEFPPPDGRGWWISEI